MQEPIEIIKFSISYFSEKFSHSECDPLLSESIRGQLVALQCVHLMSIGYCTYAWNGQTLENNRLTTPLRRTEDIFFFTFSIVDSFAIFREQC